MGLSQTILSEQDRKKLDGIVSQMQANNEPEDNIRFVVEDFKQKYSSKKKVGSQDLSTLSNTQANTNLSLGGEKNQISQADKNALANFAQNLNKGNGQNVVKKLPTQNQITQVKPKRILTSEEVEKKAQERLSDPYNQLASNNSDDPIGSYYNTIQNSKALSVKGEDKIDDANEAAIHDKMSDMIVNNGFSNAKSASDYLYNQVKKVTGREVPINKVSIDELKKVLPNNLSTEAALKKVAANQYIGSIMDESKNFDDFIQKYPSLSQKFSDINQNTEEGKAQAYNLILNDPDVIEAAKDRPEIWKQYLQERNNFNNKFPDLAKQQIASKISQYREDIGKNNKIFNNPSKESWDKVVDQMYKEGKIDASDKAFYNQNITPSDLKTTGLLESTWRGYEQGVRQIGQTIGLQDLGLLKDMSKESQVNPTRNLILGGGGHLMGNIVPMLLTGGALKGVGFGEKAANSFAAMLQFGGGNAEQSKKYFPNNPIGQFAYTTLGTTIDAMLMDLPTRAQQGIKQFMSGEAKALATKLSDKTISDAVKEQMKQSFVNKFIGASKRYGIDILKHNAQTAGVLTSVDLLKRGLNLAAGDKEAFDNINIPQEAINNFLMASPLSAISALGALKGKKSELNTAISELPESVYTSPIKDALKNGDVPKLETYLKDVADQLSNPQSETFTRKVFGDKLSDIVTKLYPNAKSEPINIEQPINTTNPTTEQNGAEVRDTENEPARTTTTDNGLQDGNRNGGGNVGDKESIVGEPIVDESTDFYKLKKLYDKDGVEYLVRNPKDEFGNYVLQKLDASKQHLNVPEKEIIDRVNKGELFTEKPNNPKQISNSGSGKDVGGKGVDVVKNEETTAIRNDKNHTTYDINNDGEKVGSIAVNYREDLGGYQVESSNVETPNKGIGTEAYKQLISKLDKPLISDSSLTEPAERLWKKLEKEGLATYDEKLGKYKTISTGKEDVRGEKVEGKKDYELTPAEYEKERQASIPIFNEARHIAGKIFNWSGTDGLYQKYLESKGVKPNDKGVFEDTSIDDVEDYMKFLLKEKADFFSKEDYDTYLKYKNFMDRGILPDWSNHETKVSIALTEGKKVPKEVLDEYPDLKQQANEIPISTDKNKKEDVGGEKVDKPDYAMTEDEYLKKYVDSKYDEELAKEDYKNIIEKSKSDIVYDGKDYWWRDDDEGIWWKLDDKGEIIPDQQHDNKPEGKTLSALEYDKILGKTYTTNEIPIPSKEESPTIKEPNTDKQGAAEEQAKPIIPTNEGQPPSETPPVEPPKEDEGGKVSGITHADTAETRKELGLPEYKGLDRKGRTNDSLIDDARQKIAENPNAANEVMDKYKAGGKMTPEDNAILSEYKAALDYQLEKNPSKEVFDKIQELIKVLEPAGSEAGELLQSRKLLSAQEDNLSNFLLGKQEAQGAPLSEKQFKEETAKYEELKKANEELKRQLQEEKEKYNKLAAEKGINQAKAEARKASKKSKEEYRAERKKIVDDIKKKWKDVGKDGKLSSDIPFRQQLSAIAPDVKKYVQSLLEEGVDKLDDIATVIHADLKDFIDGIKKSDIIDMIAGEYDLPTKEQTRNQKANAVRLLQREAKLVNELRKVRKGEENVKSETERVAKARRIQELEDKIREVREQNKRNNVEESPDDKAIGEGELNDALEKKLLARAKKLQEDLKNKNFLKEKPKPPTFKKSRKAQILEDRVIDLENKIRHERSVDEYNKRGKLRKAYDFVMETLGIRRLVQAAVDMSVPFRQGATLLSPRQVDVWGKGFMANLRSVFNPKKFERIMYGIRHDPQYHDMIKDRVVFNDLGSADPNLHNEDFRKSWIYKIPILKEPLMASNRSADAFLNVARYEMYKKLRTRLEQQGLTRETDPQAFKYIGNWVMSMTGRGRMTNMLENSVAHTVLGNTFFGARLMASRFNMLNPVTYFDPRVPRQAKVEAMKDIAAWVTTTMVIGAALGATTGAKISLNPDDSDFLQLRYGNKVYDISGGLANYIRTFLRMGKAGYIRATGTKYEGRKATENAGQSVLTFFRNKLSPNTAFVTDMYFGKAYGQQFDPYDALRIYPMYGDDAWKALKEDGAVSLATVLLPNLVGIGYGSYASKGQIDATLDDLLKRNLRSDEMNSENIKNYNEGGRPVTYKEFVDFASKRDSEIEKEITDLYKNGANILDNENNVVHIPYAQMTKEQVAKETSRIKAAATRKVKTELFGEKPEDVKEAEKELREANNEEDDNQ